MNDITAIVLAAGYSFRMGEFKPLLRLGDMSLLERNIRLFQSAGIRDIRVVAGYRAAEIQAVLDPMGILCIVNRTYDQGMYSSVLAGISTLTSDQKAFFVLPADIPLVRPHTLKSLLTAYRESQKPHPIFYPNFQGMRGHPPLIDSSCAAKMKQWDQPGGLRAFLENYESNAADVSVTDEGILQDLDTPEDYQRMLERYPDLDIPTVRECDALMERYQVPEHTARHCQAVARVAVCMGKALIQAGCRMNLHLITAAALLHDMAKGQRRHAAAGEQILHEMGFPAVAEIVGAHVDLPIRDSDPVTEKEVVHLADKLVKGDRRVSVETRFLAKRIRYENDPQAKAGVEKRFANAMKMKMRVESETGKSLEIMLEECLH
ncbi:MAG: NTP transferase domain-containing protein [Desulfobacterales bacterium]